MTKTQRAAMQQALECLNGVARGKYDGNAAGVCAALDAALAEPKRKRRTVKDSLTDDGWKRTRDICS